MSGHSKWSTIKRQKGAKDVQRGLLFTKLANAVTIAAKSGGPDPESNFKLRLAIDKAHEANMPRENIDRAIERARGAAESSNFEEVTYEGYGPSKVGLLIAAATDNKNRTLSAIKSTLDKNGGVLASQGAVAWQFKPIGELVVKLDGKSIDDLTLAAADAGAEDVIPNDEESDTAIIQTEPNEVETVRSKLTGWEVKEAKLSYKPTSTVEISDEAEAERVINLIDALEGNEDVQEVVSNLG
jgi:YebC/PmpR family DNA-binding regulatory protein